jgi:ureidoacrylate peracid hydrolase
LEEQLTERVVNIETTRGSVAVDLARAALLVVDMQNDFGSKGGMFDRAGFDTSSIRGAVEPTARVLVSARRAAVPVVYLKMAFQPDLSDLGAPGSPSRERHLGWSVGERVTDPSGRPSRILIRDTWNTDVLDELKPQPGDLVVYKNRFSGFYGTDLDSILASRGVKWLIVTGCTTSVCVESTIRDAMFRDYACVLLADCSAEPIGSDLPRTNHEASLLLVEAAFGSVSSSAQFLRALETGGI